MGDVGPESRGVGSSALPPGAAVVRITRQDRIAASARLVGGATPNARQAGRAFLERAGTHGIDLRYFWGVRTGSGVFTQAVLVVPQTGRTAMVFLSGPGPERVCGHAGRQTGDRVALMRFAFRDAETMLGDEVHLIQALPSPDEGWGIEAFTGAGMTRLGDLAYLRRPLSMPFDAGEDALPDGVGLRRVGDLDHGDAFAALRRALERTYIGTMDCPGLCELRRTEDVIESHRAAGEYEDAQWWIVEAEGEPEGCVLLSPSREMRSLELVYMGLGPRLRGRGLGAVSLRLALSKAQRLPLDQVSCAVDLSNEPARALYARLGFSEFARRVAFVLPTATGPTRRGSETGDDGVSRGV